MFTYTNPTAQKVCVAGEFNNWSSDSNPMLRTAGGVWVLRVELSTGAYQYLFTVDGKWISDPKARLSHPNFHGGTNSVILV
jgi:1,4-alpha-glucan branching enzyme